jgi:hypothetical protein
MNHDIIAAGHPALYFDYGTYIKAYPKHWRDTATDPVRKSLQQWLIGQVAKADSELELISSRIHKTQPHSTWPEFSNYQCTSCHQNITDKSLAQIQDQNQDAQRGNNIGQASVRMWNLEGLQAADSALGSDRKLTDDLIQWIQQASSRSGDTDSNRKSILHSIEAKRMDLAEGLGMSNRQILQNRLTRWTSEQQRTFVREKWQAASESLNWEQTALAYLAQQSSLPSPTDRSPLERMRTRLIFPESTQSPGFLFPKGPAEAKAQLQSHSWKSDTSLILESLGP